MQAVTSLKQSLRQALAAILALLIGINGTGLAFASKDYPSRPIDTKVEKEKTKLSSEQKASLAKSFGQMPLYFIENRGQVDKQVGYYVQGSDKTLYFTPRGVTFSLRGENTGHTLKLDFVGANQKVQLIGEQQTEAVISYFKGKESEQHRGLKTYREIVYRNLWPGIDLVYGGATNQLKYNFIVKPGADPNQIKLAWRGASKVQVNQAGEMEIETPVENLKDERPVSYQEIDGKQVEVATDYRLVSRKGRSEYGFELGGYDRSQELIIDPAVIVYCGFIGGNSNDEGNDIAVDLAGNVYVTGWASSTEASFPASVGPDLTLDGIVDAFVAKVKADGTGLEYCGYIGGDDLDYGGAIAIDSAGNAYVVGNTRSTEATFPVIGGPDLTFNGGGTDAFLAKIDATGTKLVYCGYVGGSYADYGYSVAVDEAGNAYLAGGTFSTEATFPVTAGPDLTHNGGYDGYVAKISASGLQVIYCGYIGGSGKESIYSIAVDAAGNAYVTGSTDSTEATFPVIGGPDMTFNGSEDAFVAKVRSDGTGLIYCGYIGGRDEDFGYAIAVDAAGSAYVTGDAFSNEMSFPVIGGPDLTHNGRSDVFVAKVKPDGSGLIYCGYIGGNNYEGGNGIAVDATGSAYVTGFTASTEATFPVIGGPYLTNNDGGIDGFVAKVKADGSGLVYCGYIGGNGVSEGFDDDTGNGIAVDAAGNAYIVGWTISTETSFPVKVGPDLTQNGITDAFVAKIKWCDALSLTPTSLSNGRVGAIYPTQTLTAVGGAAPYSFAVSAGALPPGLSLTMAGVLSGTSTAVGTYSFTITATDASECAGAQDYTITIVDCGTLSLSTPGVLPDGKIGQEYAAKLLVKGGVNPYRYDLAGGRLPTGMMLSADGALSGVPTNSGLFTFIVKVTDANACEVSRVYRLTITR